MSPILRKMGDYIRARGRTENRVRIYPLEVHVIRQQQEMRVVIYYDMAVQNHKRAPISP